MCYGVAVGNYDMVQSLVDSTGYPVPLSFLGYHVQQR